MPPHRRLPMHNSTRNVRLCLQKPLLQSEKNRRLGQVRLRFLQYWLPRAVNDKGRYRQHREMPRA
jgi:hypothetical protein